jgi:hypothetical protein
MDEILLGVSNMGNCKKLKFASHQQLQGSRPTKGVGIVLTVPHLVFTLLLPSFFLSSFLDPSTIELPIYCTQSPPSPHHEGEETLSDPGNV